MPTVVNREEKKEQILMALEECIRERPLMNITLRQIAEKAGMTHPALLHYFPSKAAIIRAYVTYTQDFMSTHCRKWFGTHDRADYPSNEAYMNAFMAYVACGDPGEKRPNGTTQTYIYAQYDPELREAVRQEFAGWRSTMEQCLKKIYGDQVGKEQAEYMMVLISGTFLCHYTGVLTGNISRDMMSVGFSLSAETAHEKKEDS